MSANKYFDVILMIFRSISKNSNIFFKVVFIENQKDTFFCIYSKMNIPDTAFAGMSKYEHTIEKWLSG